jgi:hypothetical protein
MFVMWEILFERLKSGQIMNILSLGLEPMRGYTSVSQKAQYLNVSQRTLGTIITQTVNILQHDSADTASSLPMRDFCMANANFFQ